MTEQLNRTRAVHNYGVRDRLNREIGTIVITWDVSPDATYGLEQRAYAEGKKYGLFTQAARDGKKYGAIQSSSHYATAEERQAEINRRLADSAKRAVKRQGK